MSAELKVGIIGCGMIGKNHIRGYSEIAEAEVIAVADLDEAEANKVAEQNDIPQVFTDYHDLLKIDEIQIVDVCLPNVLHSPVSIDALEAGKHVFCEKPMARNYAEAKAMMDTAKRVGKQVGVQVATIFSPEARAAKKILDEGGLGKPYFARLCNLRRKGRPWVDGYGTPHFVSKEHAGGGSLVDMGVYHLNRLMWLLDNPSALTVSASTFQEIDIYEGRKDDMDVEELAAAFIRLDNGVTLYLEDAWALHKDKSDGDTIMGSKGGLRIDPFGYFSDLFGMEANVTFELKTAEYHQNQYDPDRVGYKTPLYNWVYGLLGRVPTIPTGEYALNTVRISDAVYESARRGEEVKVT